MIAEPPVVVKDGTMSAVRGSKCGMTTVKDLRMQ